MDRKKAFFPALFVAEAIFIFYMAIQPSSSVPSFHIPFFRGGDFEHFLAYGVLGFLGYKTFSQRFGPRTSLIISLAFCSSFGAFTETVQLFVPTRFGDPMDWLVDTLGSSAGIFLTIRAYPALERAFRIQVRNDKSAE